MKSSCLFGNHEMHLWASPFRSHHRPEWQIYLPRIPTLSYTWNVKKVPFRRSIPVPAILGSTPTFPVVMTIVFLFLSKGMSLVYSFSGVALWFCVCESSLRQSGTNQEEFSVYLLAEYHILIDCLQLPRLSQSRSLSLSHCLAPFYHRKHKKNLSLELRACENTWARKVGKSSNCLECTPINCMCD